MALNSKVPNDCTLEFVFNCNQAYCFSTSQQKEILASNTQIPISLY